MWSVVRRNRRLKDVRRDSTWIFWGGGIEKWRALMNVAEEERTASTNQRSIHAHGPFYLILSLGKLVSSLEYFPYTSSTLSSSYFLLESAPSALLNLSMQLLVFNPRLSISGSKSRLLVRDRVFCCTVTFFTPLWVNLHSHPISDTKVCPPKIVHTSPPAHPPTHANLCNT